MKEVLITIDEDEQRAVSQAETVLDLFGTDIRVHILHVFQDNPQGLSITEFATTRPVRKRFASEGVETVLHEKSVDPGTEIIKLAEEIDADVIAVAGRNRSPTGKVLFGSVAQDVMLGAARPVLLCEAHAEKH